jgi:hypothetical protein
LLAFRLPPKSKPDYFFPVKACSYCGRDNKDEARHCFECGTEFPLFRPEDDDLMAAASSQEESAIGLDQLDYGFEFLEGYSRPDWKTIHTFVKDHISPEDRSMAWRLIAAKWLEQLAKDLGGPSRVHESALFLCLSELDAATTRALLATGKSMIGSIRNYLKEAAWTGFHGKHVLLLFSDLDDYFAYISYYYPEGHHALSAGIFLRAGYAHIALPFVSLHSTEDVLRHELVHNLLCHLPIPTWLNEGLAVAIERERSRHSGFLDRDLADRHGGFWNESNIQSFWAGKSFHVPGQESELSYSLAQILVTLLSGQGKEFNAFIAQANWRDAGQEAARTVMGRDLGEVASQFLGPGNWRPQRKAISDHFQAGRRKGG